MLFWNIAKSEKHFFGGGGGHDLILQKTGSRTGRNGHGKWDQMGMAQDPTKTCQRPHGFV